MKNGVAVLDEAPSLPDGTPVRVEVERTEAAFWQDKTAEQLALEQGASPASAANDLDGDWPPEESVDDFLELIRRGRA
jgi:hypothetical protein